MGTDKPLYTTDDGTVYKARDILAILLKDACAVSAEAMNGDFVAHLLRTPFCA